MQAIDFKELYGHRHAEKNAGTELAKALELLTFRRLVAVQRIRPSQFAESRKVGVGGHEFTTVLEGECCQMSIGYQIADRLALDK
jgi:hypothetical protein